MNDYQGTLAEGLASEIMDVTYKYDVVTILPTSIGCLEAVKFELLTQASEPDDEEDDDG